MIPPSLKAKKSYIFAPDRKTQIFKPEMKNHLLMTVHKLKKSPVFARNMVTRGLKSLQEHREQAKKMKNIRVNSRDVKFIVMAPIANAEMKSYGRFKLRKYTLSPQDYFIQKRAMAKYLNGRKLTKKEYDIMFPIKDSLSRKL